HPAASLDQDQVIFQLTVLQPVSERKRIREIKGFRSFFQCGHDQLSGKTNLVDWIFAHDLAESSMLCFRVISELEHITQDEHLVLLPSHLPESPNCYFHARWI